MIVCGDGLPFMRSRTADLILTDPPHLDTFKNAEEHRYFAHNWAAYAVAALAPGGTLIHSCGSTYATELSHYLDSPHTWPLQILVWPHHGERYTEGDPTLFTPGHHFFLVYRKEPIVKLRWSGSTVLQYDDGEPLTKPLDLWTKLITSVCPPEGLVLDPFCGRGEIPAAAKETGRRYLGCDIDPEAVAYCQELGL